VRKENNYGAGKRAVKLRPARLQVTGHGVPSGVTSVSSSRRRCSRNI